MDEYKSGDTNLGSEEVDPVYKKGFEHGYWLQRGNSPDLDRVVEGAKNHQGYHSGLLAGQKEAQLEQFRQRMSDMDKNQQNDKGFEMG